MKDFSFYIIQGSWKGVHRIKRISNIKKSETYWDPLMDRDQINQAIYSKFSAYSAN